jgi:hypothetical protein
LKKDIQLNEPQPSSRYNLSTTTEREMKNKGLSKTLSTATRERETKLGTKSRKVKSLKRKRSTKNSDLHEGFPRRDNSPSNELTATMVIQTETQDCAIDINEDYSDDDDYPTEEEQYEVEKIINHITYPVRRIQITPLSTCAE